MTQKIYVQAPPLLYEGNSKVELSVGEAGWNCGKHWTFNREDN